jgi:hypothetical protein
MEFWPKLAIVQEINVITKEVVKKKTNPVPSSIVVSFAIPLNIKSMTILTRMQFR